MTGDASRKRLEETPGVDISVPNAARIYDYSLGGSHNFAVDRELVDRINAINPDGPLVPSANRAFLHRAVRYCLHRGIRQFLDLGSGIPTVGNVHEIVDSTGIPARVVYVDFEPIAVAHTHQLLAGNDRATIVAADMRDVGTVLQAPETQRLIDFRQPVGLLAVASLHYVSRDDHIETMLAGYRAALVPGSMLAISHMTADDRPELVHRLQRDAFADTSTPLTLRSHAEVTELFEGFELVEPGVVYTSQWRPDPADEPDPEPDRAITWCGVGVMPPTRTP